MSARAALRRLWVCVAALCAALAVQRAAAWGPVSHQSFACVALNDSAAFADCARAHYWFVVGANGPDAVKGASYALHDLVAAGRLAEFGATYAAPDFDAVSFARGYGVHLACDAVGHHAAGFLTPQYDHEIEFAADTYYYKAFWGSSYAFQAPNGSVKAFMDGALEYLRAADPQFPNVTAAAVNASVDTYVSLVAKEMDLVRLNFLYETELVKWDSAGATDWPSAHAHLEQAQARSVAASLFWLAQLDGGADAAAAALKTTQYVDSLFQQ